MPWKETDVRKERTKFVLEWEKRWDEGEGRLNFSQLCREFGVSRERGYVWLRRYIDAGYDVRALEDRSRRPRNSPTKTSEEIEDLVVAARKRYPKWGVRLLSDALRERYPDKPIPGPSAVGAILRRRGFATQKKRRRQRVVPRSAPFASCTEPNSVWCIDFKGWFRTGDGKKCYPLTVTDAYSRLVIRCEGLLTPGGTESRRVCDSAFQEFGLPKAIRSDNGPPFASVGPGGLTELSVWWRKLGIQHERIEPGKPQQNGRHERMHRTLKLEACTPPRANIRAQQRAFDQWRKTFNELRPHQALQGKPPNHAYEPSRRKYPRRLRSPDYPYDVWHRVQTVDRLGKIAFCKRRIMVSTALYAEPVLLKPDPQVEGKWWLLYDDIILGSILEDRLDKGLMKPRRKKPKKRTKR